MSKYHLTEIEKPEGINDRHSTKEMISIVKSAVEADKHLRVVPMMNTFLGVFTAKVARYDEKGVVFKKVEESQGFPDRQESLSAVYANLFRLTVLD